MLSARHRRRGHLLALGFLAATSASWRGWFAPQGSLDSEGPPASLRQGDLNACLGALADDDAPPSAKNLALELLPGLDLTGVLPELLREASAEDRCRIAKALGRVRSTAVVPVLIGMLRDETSVAWAADYALAEMGELALDAVWPLVEMPPEEPAWPAVDGPRTMSSWCHNVLYQMGPRAVPFLVARIRSGNAAERRKALRTLAEFHYSVFDLTDWPPDVLSTLRESLDAPDAQSRLCALRVLSQLEEPATVMAYARRLEGDRNQLVASVASSLVREDALGQYCVREAARVNRRLAAGGVGPAGKFLESLTLLHKGSCDRALADALVPLLEDPRAPVRELATDGLGGLVSLKAQRALAEALRTEDVPALRAKLLAAGPADPERHLLPLLDTADPNEKRLVIEALGGQRVREAVPALGRVLGDPGLSQAAQAALGQIADPAAVPSLIDAFRSTPPPALPWWRPQILATISGIGGTGAIDFLGEVSAGHAEREIRIVAAESLARSLAPLGRVGAVRERVESVAGRGVKDAEPDVRRAFVGLLQVTADVNKLSALIDHDGEDSVRFAATDALGGVCDPAAARKLTSLLAPGRRGERERAMWVLQRMGYCEDQATKTVLRDETGPRLVAFLRSNDEDLALSAAGVLATLKDPSALDEILIQFASKPERRVRLALSLYGYGAEAKKAVPLLKQARTGAPPELVRAIDQVLRVAEPKDISR